MEVSFGLGVCATESTVNPVELVEQLGRYDGFGFVEQVAHC